MSQKQISIEQAMALAQQHAERGDHAQARALYKQVIALIPGHREARLALKRIPAAKPGKEQFRAEMEELMALYVSGEMEAGLAEARRLSKKYKDQPMPLNVQGAILTSTNRHEEAISCFRKALHLEERYTEAWNNLGTALRKSGRNDEGRDCFQRALGLDPKNADALFNLGAYFRDSGDLEKAVALLERSIDMRPVFAPVHCALGTALRMLGRAKQSLAYFRNALDIDPRYADAYTEFGEALLQMKLYTAALENLEKAVEYDPGSAYVRYRLGFARFKAGDTEGAIEAYEQSLSISPDNEGVKHFLNVARGETSATAPPGYIKSLFDDYAPRFEQSLVDTLGYQGPQVLLDMLDETMPDRRFTRALDLGCGTGLFGALLRGRVEHLTGVDLSSEMLRQAASKNIYDALIEGDLAASIEEIQGDPDFFGAADVLIYIGDLLPVLQAIAGRAAHDAIIAISTEVLQEEGDIKLLPSGRYAHSHEYIEQTMNAAGLTLLTRKEAPLRKEETRWLTGGYYLMTPV